MSNQTQTHETRKPATRISDAEVEAAAREVFIAEQVPSGDPAGREMLAKGWDLGLIDRFVKEPHLQRQRAALEAAAAVREQAAAKLAEETGTVASLIYRGLDDAVAPEQVPMVPLSVVAEVRADLVQVACLYKPKFRFAINDAIDVIDAAFPQLKEQSDEH